MTVYYKSQIFLFERGRHNHIGAPTDLKLKKDRRNKNRKMAYSFCFKTFEMYNKIRFFLKNVGGPEKGRCLWSSLRSTFYLAAFCVFLGRRTAWMFGRTPPCAMVTPDRSLFNSSSFLMANCK